MLTLSQFLTFWLCLSAWALFLSLGAAICDVWTQNRKR